MNEEARIAALLSRDIFELGSEVENKAILIEFKNQSESVISDVGELTLASFIENRLAEYFR